MKKITLLIIGFAISFSFSFGAMPPKVFAPYVDVMLWPTYDLMNCYNTTGQKYYTLAFITAGSDGQPSWGGVLDLSSNHMLDQVNNLQAVGGDVIISFGGANGSPISSTITNVNSLVTAYESVINKYGISWIDFDIEGIWVQDEASIDRRNQAAVILQSRNPGLKITYCLPVMPYGLTAAGVNVIDNAKAAGVNIYGVNVMAMDYGQSNSNMGDAAISAAENTRSQTGLEIGITPMIGQNDTQNEVFTLSNASQVLSFANSTSWINMIAMWSVNRDNGGCAGQTSASPTCSGLSQTEFAFLNIFKPYSGEVTGNPILTSIVVTPSSTSLTVGQTLQYAAQGKDQNGGNMYTAVSWTSTGGTIDESGLYTATTAGTFTVEATSGSISGTASITVTPPGECNAPQYVAGTTYATGAEVANINKKYDCKVGGWCSSSAAWAYEPGVGEYWQDAWTETGPCITGGNPVLTTIEVSPSNTTIEVNQTQQFIAQGKDQNGNNMSTTVSWSTTTNAISSSGLYSGTTATTSVVTATSGSVSGSTNITVSPVGGGSCTAPVWSATQTYTGGEIVSHNNHEWKAKWWTLNEEPGTTGQWGVWEDLGVCNTSLLNNFGSMNTGTINAYPNPFSATTTLSFDLDEDSHINIKIYNHVGMEVRSLINTYLPKGIHEVQLDCSALPSGLYIYKINYNNYEKSGSLIKK